MPAGWSRRLKRLDAVLPGPPVGSRHWLEVFAWADFHFRLSEREPDFAGLLAAYGRLVPPYGEEAERLFRHLSELFGRAVDGVPPCSGAEFAELEAWLAAHGDSLPTFGWGRALEEGGGAAVTLAGMRWQVGQGPGADGSGRAAETIRRFKARHAEATALPSGAGDAPRAAGGP
jgi:hypothetical protein